jgi:ABC-type nitrate/sulfonate/bicarbonate transport system substrate-binding protein
MKKSSAVLLIMVLTCLLIVSCRNKSNSLEQNELSVRLKWLNQAQFAGFYYAQDKGLYKNKGLNVNLRAGGIDYPAIQMVASGSDQFGVTGADQILIAREKGIPLVAIACIYRKSPFVLFSLKESGINKVEDFVGKKIGVKLGGNEELTYRAMMKNANVPSSKVNEIPIKFDITPLLNKQIDVWPGYSINEPITAQEKGFDVTLIWPNDYGIDFYADVLFTTEEYLKKNYNTAKSLVEATVQGWKLAFENKEEAISYVLKTSDQLNADHEMKMLMASFKLIIPDEKPIGWMDSKIWKQMAALMKEAGFLKTDLDIEKAYRIDLLPRIAK